MTDVNKVEVEFNEDGTPKDPPQDPQEGQTVPYSRFKEVNDERKELLAKVGEPDKEDPPVPAGNENREAEAKEYLSGLVKDTLEQQKKDAAAAKTAEEQRISREIDDALDVHTDVKRVDFKKFYDKEGKDFSSVDAAISNFKKLQGIAKKEEEDRGKDGRPKVPSNEGGGTPKEPYDVSDKSMDQIAEESIKEFNL
jgi:hypothetical protein